MSLLPAVLLAIGEVGVVVCYNSLGLPIPRVTQAIQVLGQYVVLRHFLWVMNRHHRWGLQFDLGLYSALLEPVRGLFRTTFCSWTGFGSVIAILLLLSLGQLALELTTVLLG
jgi:hypothetical protein